MGHEWVRVAVLQGSGESGGTSVTMRTLYLHRPAGGIWEAVTEGATGGGQLLQVITDRLAEGGTVPAEEYQ